MKKLQTNSEEIIEKRYRNFMLLLYKDSTLYNYDELLFDLKGSFKNYAYIEHEPESDEKKQHIHFILSLDNTRTITSLSSRLGLPSNYIQNIKSLRASCRYLTHKDSEDKTQYDLNCVKVSNSFRDKFMGAYDDLFSDFDILNNIYQFIQDNCFLSPIDLEIELTKYCVKCGFDSIFKRYYNTIVKYINFSCK